MRVDEVWVNYELGCLLEFEGLEMVVLEYYKLSVWFFEEIRVDFLCY